MPLIALPVELIAVAVLFRKRTFSSASSGIGSASESRLVAAMLAVLRCLLLRLLAFRLSRLETEPPGRPPEKPPEPALQAPGLMPPPSEYRLLLDSRASLPRLLFRPPDLASPPAEGPPHAHTASGMVNESMRVRRWWLVRPTGERW
jgi:hypothetical protein